jgi:hypothetical protein
MGHSNTTPSSSLAPSMMESELEPAGLFRQSWWKLCLHKKWTVGRSNVFGQAEQRVALKVSGFVDRRVMSSSLVAVSAR